MEGFSELEGLEEGMKVLVCPERENGSKGATHLTQL